MRILLTFAFLLNAIGVTGCECLIISPIKNKENLKTYDFVALVKVERIDPATDNSREDRDIKIQVKELFKGSTTMVLNIQDFNNP
ncbi:hypothetical protein [Mucilaginibacter sp.]|uniref:hypothetical protein n=1 Tax=Mucilaginibacter sp. TaxID=1882438 RepID=UPI00262C8566|nr:hypothetical protein [Mucilaginibacter sp.]MDB5029822.1 hypothetical protein [Mucilaginibacter sp.]